MDVWDITAGVPIVQTFPTYLRHFLSQFAWDPKIYKKSTPLQWNKWKISWKIALDVITNRSLLTMKSGALGLTFQQSTIKHEKADLETFAEKQFAENALLGHYYGTFVYLNLGGRSSTPK